jgi:hypothetical protein
VTPLRSYLIWLLPPTAEAGAAVVLHYVVEETAERAAEAASLGYPAHRVLGLRDVSDELTAA